MANSGPVVLCVLDGWGLSERTEANAPHLARTPNVDALMRSCPNSRLTAHGPDVGVPEGQMGNSEVGHVNIGAGRVIESSLRAVQRTVGGGGLAGMPAMRRFADGVGAAGGAAHVMGVMSDGGVHAHVDHMAAAAAAVAAEGVPVAVHVFTDGRDVAPGTAPAHLDRLIRALPEGAFVATLSGRHFAMDRDRRWERTALAFRAIALGGGRAAPDAAAALEESFGEGTTDEFVEPRVLGGYRGMRDGDGVLCVNFRADRARQLLAALADPGFDSFDVSGRPALSAACGFVEYSKSHAGYMDCVFSDEVPANTLGEWVAARGLRQFRVAETEKYPHVTFFLNGGREEPFPGEDRHMAPSPKVATYDLAPEMSAAEVTARLAGAIAEGYGLIVANYANPDMVGHTGDLAAAVAACEAVDRGLGAVAEALRAANGAMLVFADHGNCETMIDPDTGGPHTAHTLNPVPAMLVGGAGVRGLRSGRLADVAPTALDLLGLPQPPEMTGSSLLERGG